MARLWRDIEGFEGLYQISNLGEVKSLMRTIERGDGVKMNIKEKILKPQIGNHGYLTVSLCSIDKKIVTKRIHRLVAEAFIPNSNNLPQVNHKDENKLNNKVDNLEWCTQQYNLKYGEAAQIGNITRRKPVLQYSLDGELIAEHESTLAAAKAIGVYQGNISKVCRGETETAKGFIFKFKNNESEENYNENVK